MLLQICKSKTLCPILKSVYFPILGMCGIDFFSFGSVSVRFLKKNSDSVRNEFGSVRFAKTRFGSDSYLLLM